MNYTDSNHNGQYDEGEPMNDVNGNGIYDDAEPFVDLSEPFLDANDNSQWDPGEFFKDSNGNGRWDPPNGRWDSDTQIWTETRILETGNPVTGQGADGATLSTFDPSSGLTVADGGSARTQLSLVDINLNRLRPSTSTGLSASNNHVKATFESNGSTSASYADSLGLTWGLATDCVAGHCDCSVLGTVCVVSSYVQAYTRGVSQWVTITDARADPPTQTNPDPAGDDGPFTVTASYSGCGTAGCPVSTDGTSK